MGKENSPKNHHYSEQTGHQQRGLANKFLRDLELKNPGLPVSVVLLPPPEARFTSRRSMRRPHPSGKRNR